MVMCADYPRWTHRCQARESNVLSQASKRNEMPPPHSGTASSRTHEPVCDGLSMPPGSRVIAAAAASTDAREAGAAAHYLSGTAFAIERIVAGGFMSLVRLLGFSTLSCGCVVGRYRDVATSRELAYVEEKGPECHQHAHRRNHTLAIARRNTVAIARAS